MSLRMLNNQRGIALVSAIFLMVVLAAIGAFMVRIYGVQSRTIPLVIGGAEAYQAARDGIEWGIGRALASPSSCLNPYLDQTMEGFTVTVDCQATEVSEGGVDYNVYNITAFAERGAYGTPDYFSRQIEVKVTNAN